MDHPKRSLLTIELRLDGDALSRRYPDEPGLPASMLPGHGGTPPANLREIGKGYEACGTYGLWALEAVLHDGKQSTLGEHLSGAQLDRAGLLLFELLFGDEACFRRLTRSAGAPLGDDGAPFSVTAWPRRVRICAQHERLTGLPWRAVQYRGQILAQKGWTFEVWPGESPEPGRGPVRCTHRTPGKVLLVLPERPLPGAPLKTEQHQTTLMRLFDNIWPEFTRSDDFRTAQVRAELALPSGWQPDLVYFYGHGRLDPNGRLELLVEDAPQSWMSMRDFAARFHQPGVVFVNACSSGQGGLHATYEQFDSSLVIANSTTAFGEPAHRFAEGWFRDWLFYQKDPVLSAHPPVERSSHFTLWATPIVHARHDEWASLPTRPRFRDLAPPEQDFDRWAQRERAYSILKRIRDDLKLHALIGCGVGGNAHKDLAEQMISHVEKDDTSFAIGLVRLDFPALFAGEGSNVQMQALRDSFESAIAPWQSLGELAAVQVPMTGAGRTSILWLDWRVLPPGDGHPQQLDAWLKFLDRHVAPQKVEGVHIVASITVEAAPGSIRKTERWLAKASDEGTYWNEKMVLEPLKTLGEATPDEIRQYLSAHRCDGTIVKDLAALIYQRSEKGRYELACDLMRRAADPLLGWDGLYEELKATSSRSPTRPPPSSPGSRPRR